MDWLRRFLGTRRGPSERHPLINDDYRRRQDEKAKFERSREAVGVSGEETSGRPPKDYQHPDLFRSREATLDPDFVVNAQSQAGSDEADQEEAFLGRFVQRLKRRGTRHPRAVCLFSTTSLAGGSID
jgi:hypothetical protein